MTLLHNDATPAQFLQQSLCILLMKLQISLTLLTLASPWKIEVSRYKEETPDYR